MPSPFFLLSFSFIFLFQTHVLTATKIDTSCAPFNCGSFKNITYPFSSLNTHAKFCGHPKFKVDCKHGNMTLVIKSQKFIILDLNQSSQLLTIARADLYSPHTIPSCTLKYTNVEVDLQVFDYTFKDLSYTLLSECVLGEISYPLISKINPKISEQTACIKDGKFQISYLVLSSRVQDYTFLNCTKNITVIGLNTSVTNNNLTLEQGFEVRWRDIGQDRCDHCIRSGERCGYNTSQKAVVCISTKKAMAPSALIAPTSNGTWKWKRILIIGVISIVIAAFIVITFMYYYRRLNHNSTTESHIHSTNLSSHGSQRITRSQNFGVQHFVYHDLELATNSFSIDNRIGDGGSGAVYHGILQDGREVAVKHLDKYGSSRDQQFENEITVLANVLHPHLVLLYGCTTLKSREALVVYEFVRNGTVADHLHGNKATPGKLPWPTRMRIAVETASALKYLHSCKVIHRDIKTSNILLDSDYHVKVADFGLARFIPTDHSRVSTTPQGTLGYLDPEYNITQEVTYKTDVYCFGVILIELITSFPAYDVERKNTGDRNLSETAIKRITDQTFHGIVDRTLGFDSDSRVWNMINGVVELSYQCLQSSGDMRPTMKEVFERLQFLSDDEIQPEVAGSSSPNEEIRLINNDLASLSSS